MAFLKNKWVVATLVILCWALIASFTAGYYYYQYSALLVKTRGKIIRVSLGVNYGNGRPAVWFNGTEVKMGATLLDVTMLVVKVNYTMYPGMGALVNSIDGVANSHPYYWMW